MNDMNGFRSRIQSFVGVTSGKSQDGSNSGISNSTSSLFTTDGKLSDLVTSFVNLLPVAKPTFTSLLNDDKTITDSVFEGIKNKMFDKKPSREELVDRLRERYSTTSITFEADTFSKRNTSDTDMNHLLRQKKRKQLKNECSTSLDDSAFPSNSTSDAGKAMVKGQSLAANLGQSSRYVKDRSQTMFSTGPSPYANAQRRYSNVTGRRKVEVENHPVYVRHGQRNQMQNRQASNLGTSEKRSELAVSSHNSCNNDIEEKTLPRGQNVSASDAKFNVDQAPLTVAQSESSSKEKDKTEEPLQGCNKNSPIQNVPGELISNKAYVATINFSVQYLIITKRLKISLSCINNICFPKSNEKARRYIIHVSLTGKKQKYTKSIKLMNGTPTQLQKDIYFNNLELCAAHMTSVIISLYKRRKILPNGRYPLNGCVTDLEDLDIVGKVKVSKDMTEC